MCVCIVFHHAIICVCVASKTPENRAYLFTLTTLQKAGAERTFISVEKSISDLSRSGRKLILTTWWQKPDH
jgi:hypothetical protein